MSLFDKFKQQARTAATAIKDNAKERYKEHQEIKKIEKDAFKKAYKKEVVRAAEERGKSKARERAERSTRGLFGNPGDLIGSRSPIEKKNKPRFDRII